MNWNDLIAAEKEKDYFQDLLNFIEDDAKEHTIFPPKKDWFRAFEMTPIEQTKVVIIGQDPYHGEGQAHGLSFSVPDGIKIPPSLRNIYKELESDLGVEIPISGNLSKWASQGVLLLNNVLTVRESQAASHQKKGWEKFTDEVVRCLDNSQAPLVFFLWGSPAQKKGKSINRDKHLVIESVHPSPLSSYRGFFGSKPFSKANEFLKEKGREEVDWSLTEFI